MYILAMDPMLMVGSQMPPAPWPEHHGCQQGWGSLGSLPGIWWGNFPNSIEGLKNLGEDLVHC